MAGQDGVIQDAGARDSSSQLSMTLATTALVVIPLLMVLKRLLFPVYDSREPPVLRPKVPFFGHVVSLVRESSNFHARLYREKPMPICTLPMLHGKMYIVNSPGLIQAAMRNNDVSFYPFQIEATSGLLGLPQHHIEKFDNPKILHHVEKTIAAGLMKEPLRRINTVALEYCSEILNDIGPDSQLKTTGWKWIQDVIAMAAGKALYGKNNVWDAEKFEDLWIFDKNLAVLTSGIAPKLLAGKAVAARERMRELLNPFYANELDRNSDVAAILQGRANYFRDLGIPSDELSRIEILMPWSATTNTIPTMFWMFVNVFSRPEYVERIRREVSAMAAIVEADQGGREVTIDTRVLEAACPFLMACYREVLWLYTGQIFSRRAMEDVTLDDPDGRQYLLKKGTNLQWSTDVIHVMPEVWGDDAASFNAERFLDVTPEQEKRRRGFMLPFGGGKHLCPGRYFAQAEILGIVSALALGYDVEGAQVPPPGVPPLGAAAQHPIMTPGDDNIKITRRKGWEDVKWKFAC